MADPALLELQRRVNNSDNPWPATLVIGGTLFAGSVVKSEQFAEGLAGQMPEDIRDDTKTIVQGVIDSSATEDGGDIITFQIENLMSGSMSVDMPDMVIRVRLERVDAFMIGAARFEH